MSLQASVHYYSAGGAVPTSERPIYKNRFGTKPIRSESHLKSPNPSDSLHLKSPNPSDSLHLKSPNPSDSLPKHKRGRSESPKRMHPVKVDISHPTEKIGIFPDPMRRVHTMHSGGMSQNEMRNMVMGSHQPFSCGAGSIHFESGGKVPYTPDSKTVLAEIPTKGVDKVPALLQTGEIVIPKKYATKVNKMIKKEGIHLPGC